MCNMMLKNDLMNIYNTKQTNEIKNAFDKIVNKAYCHMIWYSSFRLLNCHVFGKIKRQICKLVI